MYPDLPESLNALVQLAVAMPGEFELGYWGGVTDADAWWVRFEGDIHDGRVFVTARSPAEALRLAHQEAVNRIPL